MLKKIRSFLTGIPMTAVSGAALLLSFILSRLGTHLPIDPAWAAVAISGLPLFYLAVTRLINNRGITKISSALLISIAMVAAICIGDLFAAGEVAFIMAIGEILEELTTDRAKKGLHGLISLAPTKGRRLAHGVEEDIEVTLIKKGDVLRVLPGETIPVDGVIIDGETTVDQSVVTGESLPVDKAVGDEVFCGTVNRFGAIDVRATKVGEEGSLQKLIALVREAEEKKAPMARTADKCAAYLVPAALLIALLTYIITRDVVRAVTILVVFCPCALVLATPTAIMAAIGQATRHGVIIKSGEALETMGKADIIAFDKTGTITHGKPKVTKVISLSDMSEGELLILAAAVERKSEHPLAKAIVERAKDDGIASLDAEYFAMESGKGVYARVGGKKILCGSEKFMLENGVGISDAAKGVLREQRLTGMASVLVAVNGVLSGIIALSDTLRANAAEVIQRIHGMGVETVLLTGDNRLTAEYFAAEAGISSVRAELLPEEKLSAVEEMKASRRNVCMIGDGVNDAPALKAASVGVAMGTIGSDIAIEAADIALMGDDISKIPYLKMLSLETLKTIKISITLSMIVNVLAVALSVLGLLGPTTGALVHNAGSCFVILFAALLYDRKI